jgi:hypothetical protein
MAMAVYSYSSARTQSPLCSVPENVNAVSERDFPNSTLKCSSTQTESHMFASYLDYRRRLSLGRSSLSEER